jgi:hypothetical protein
MLKANRSAGNAAQSVRHSAFERSIVTSLAGSAASAFALVALSAFEGRGGLRPINATSHWLHGTEAADRPPEPTVRDTAVGLVTHHLATMFWAVLLEKWLGPRERTLPELALAGASTAALAAVVDYGLMPRRLSPGWELSLTRKSMAGAFAAMAAGLAAGAFAARRLPAGRRP